MKNNTKRWYLFVISLVIYMSGAIAITRIIEEVFPENLLARAFLSATVMTFAWLFWIFCSPSYLPEEDSEITTEKI